MGAADNTSPLTRALRLSDHHAMQKKVRNQNYLGSMPV